jgi:hypothetical protein
MASVLGFYPPLRTPLINLLVLLVPVVPEEIAKDGVLRPLGQRLFLGRFS